MESIQDFIAAITEKNFVQATLSKPRPFSPYSKLTIRPVQIQSELKFQAVYKTTLHDQVENFTMELLKVQLHMWLVQNFYFANLKTRKEDINLMQSKKGQLTITRKSSFNKAKSTSHDRQKNRAIAPDAPFLIALGLSSKSGNVHNHGQKKYKQINRYVEIIQDLIKEESVDHIVDMGSGKGYLTFALYVYLHKQNPNIQMEGIEIRQDLVDKCNKIAKESGYDGLTFRQGSIEEAKLSKADMVIALHACDIATDMAISKGVKAKAKFIAVAPCCHKQVRKEMSKTTTVLTPILQHGVLKERQAEMVTDTIRALLLESEGYSSKVFEFIDTEHTPKNVMISGTYTGNKKSVVLEQVESLKKEFGIKTHYLETLL